MNLEKLKETWKKEEQYCFKGWDFSHIDNRAESEKLPWDYKEIVKSYMGEEKMLLDMGTGGGEFLLSLDPTAGKTYATESYPPNIKLSKKVLIPHGIKVKAVSDDKNLPFENEYFDIIINRHESFCLDEIKRILKPKGTFITQQVGGKNNRELSKCLLGKYPDTMDSDFGIDKALKQADEVGLEVIEKGEYFPKMSFYDIGALVFFVKIVEWEFPGFSVDRCFDRLVELQQRIEKDGYVETTEHRYYMILKKI